jgi:hypothetical protein
VHAVLGKRLAKFGLELHPGKTRLIDFRPPAERVSAYRQRSLGAYAQGDQPAVPPHAVLADGRSTASTQPDAGGALRLLRHHRQLSTLGLRGPLDAADLAQLVVAAFVEELRYWEQFLRLVARYPLPAARIVHRYT